MTCTNPECVQKLDSSSIDEVLDEWMSKNRKMGCVAATQWAIRKLKKYKFKALRLNRYTSDGEVYQHVVAFNGKVIIDLAPYSDAPSGETVPDPCHG